MKTLTIIFCLLASSLLLLGCGRPAKEGTPPQEIVQNSTAKDNHNRVEVDLTNKITKNDLPGLKEVIRESAIDIKDTRLGADTPLIAAIKSSAFQVMNYLIEKGASIEETSDNGETPLMVAIRLNLADVVHVLIQRQARLDRKNLEGDTALHIAIKNNFEDLALVLVRHGANIKITDRDNLTPIELSEDFKLDALRDNLVKMLQVDIGALDLHSYRMIIVGGDLKTLAQTLKANKGIAQSYEVINPLLILLGLERENDAQQMMRLLLSNEMPVSPNGHKDGDYPPLVKAAMQGRLPFVQLLLDYDAALNLPDKHGRTALIHAVALNNLEMVDTLLDKKAKVKYKLKRRSDGKKASFNACSVVRTVGKKLKNAESKKINKSIKKRLDCGLFDWLF